MDAPAWERACPWWTHPGERAARVFLGGPALMAPNREQPREDLLGPMCLGADPVLWVGELLCGWTVSPCWRWLEFQNSQPWASEFSNVLGNSLDVNCRQQRWRLVDDYWCKNSQGRLLIMQISGYTQRVPVE